MDENTAQKQRELSDSVKARAFTAEEIQNFRNRILPKVEYMSGNYSQQDKEIDVTFTNNQELKRPGEELEQKGGKKKTKNFYKSL